MSLTRSLFLVLTLFGALTCGFTITGCSTRPAMTPQEQQANRERESIERPARPIEDESTFTDRIGQVGVVLLIVGVTLAGILVPILLLS
jgi:hypothetical protein